MKDWIPLINKLVWPVIVGIVLLIFHNEVSVMYNLTVNRIKAGGSIEIGGFFKLGDKATNTEIKELSGANLSIDGVGGAGGGVTKGSRSALEKLQDQLASTPNMKINALLITDDIRNYSIKLLKAYVATLGLRYVVFQQNNKFTGWMNSGPFVAQLPADPEDKMTIPFVKLADMKGINKHFVKPGASAKEVLEKMQKLGFDSMPVVDENMRWQSFVNRGEILAHLMSSLILADKE